jgi:tetraacyldisaccharide 4'-kinase
VNLLASIYGTVVSARNALYDRKVFHGHRLQGPVISVGNLTVGGSGKTPFTILLGELLKARGIKFDVLSRGYGRESRGVLLVDPAGSPQAFGDEPILISRKLQVPVVVGESRHEAGLFAERTFGPQLHLLDDGFQHRSLARDFDIVLLSSDDANDTLLPTGRLREPLSSLKRADAIVISDNHVPEMLPQLNKPIWKIQREILVESPPARPIAFCGIARPEGFFSQLRSAGIEPVGEARFRDHHRYSLREIQALGKLREEHKADGFITTEKDLINLREYRRDLDPVAVAKVTMELENPNNAVDTMLRIISTRAPGHEKILLTS